MGETLRPAELGGIGSQERPRDSVPLPTVHLHGDHVDMVGLSGTMIDMVDMVMISSGCDPGSDVMASVTPKYEQFAEMIRQQIRSGQLRPRDRLPSNTQYAADGWKKGTYVRGMQTLRAEGWVRGQPGEAVFVADTPPQD